MYQKKLGNTGLFVSELCLGTMTFGGGAGMWRQIGALVMRAPTPQDLRKAYPRRHDDNGSARLLAALCNVPPAVIRELDEMDARKLAAAYAELSKGAF